MQGSEFEPPKTPLIQGEFSTTNLLGKKNAMKLAFKQEWDNVCRSTH